MNVNELIESIGSKRQYLNELYKEYKDGMVELANIKKELHEKLHENGLRSAKTENYGVSIVSKPKIEIRSEQAVKEWLENTPDIEPDAYIGLKLTPFKTMAISMLKQTGEVIEGVDYSSEETLTVRGKK